MAVYRRGNLYYVQYAVLEDGEKKRRTSRGFRSKVLAKRFESERALESEASLAGLLTDEDEGLRAQAGRPIAEHVDEWREHLTATDVSSAQIDLLVGRVKRTLAFCGVERVSALSVDRVQRGITALRDNGCGTKRPRSHQTCNHTVRALKQFSRWLLLNDRVRKEPLLNLKGFKVETDRRHDRRALTGEELERLIVAAENDGRRRFQGLSGGDRAMLYRVAALTGFRRNELGSLTPAAFELDGDMPTVTVEAGYSKHRRRDVQPIPRGLAEMLREWLKGKAARKAVWTVPAGRARKERKRAAVLMTARMMRHDLERARVLWLAESADDQERERREKTDFLKYRDRAGRFADFHALRHSYVSQLARSTAPVKVIQTLARHSTPDLTLRVYSHVQRMDQAAALRALPELGRVKREASGQAARVQADGTTGRRGAQNPPHDVCKLSALCEESGENGVSSRDGICRAQTGGVVAESDMRASCGDEGMVQKSLASQGDFDSDDGGSRAVTLCVLRSQRAGEAGLEPANTGSKDR